MLVRTCSLGSLFQERNNTEKEMHAVTVEIAKTTTHLRLFIHQAIYNEKKTRRPKGPKSLT